MKSLFLPAVRPTIFFLGIAVACVSVYGQGPITLSVDLRDAPQKLLSATEIIPVRPGAMTLAYPKWIGNEHEFWGADAAVQILGGHDIRCCLRPSTRHLDIRLFEDFVSVYILNDRVAPLPGDFISGSPERANNGVNLSPCLVAVD